MLLAGEQKGGAGLWRELLQDPLRLRHHDVGDVVLVSVREGLHEQGILGDIPTGGADGHGAGDVEAAFDLADGDVALAVAVLITPGSKSDPQASRQLPEPIIGLGVFFVGCGVFVSNGHVQAVVLAHREAGQVPVVVVGVHDLHLIWRAVIRTPRLELFAVLFCVVLGLVGWLEALIIAPVGEHLHDPHHPHLVVIAPCALAGPVEHAGRERLLATARLALDQVQGHVGQQVAIIVFLADGDAIGL